MNSLVNVEWLFQHLKDVRVIDCRFNLANPEEGIEQYRTGHIPGAVYFHLEQDLSSKVEKHGGRHPLPLAEQFVQKAEAVGITNDTKIVVYDNGEGSFAARCWWVFHYFGHEQVYILDGGFKEWLASGHPTESKVQSFGRGEFTATIQTDMVADYKQVKEAIEYSNNEVVLIDSREEKRYLGLIEPIDKKAGHIPGAMNKVWMDTLSEGKFKSIDEQKQRFSEIEKDKHIIVYCGSGITASPNYLALKEAGYKNVKLYPGSFSDWISYDEHPIATKEN
ncbi:sulfurtransferase [Cytobacillus sp. FSL R7-0696]|uniref:sulfurtransferase n=1 Tax=Cytobacillus sp. FSL R7-0696 TaxID=2921691 RepID=UPI0030F935BA